MEKKLMNPYPEEKEVDQTKYCSMIGSIMYQSGNTRPDISLPTIYGARFMQNPTERYEKAVKEILAYLK
jgi:hypothetical protein